MRRVNCPQCQRGLNIPDNNGGKVVRCPACKAKFSLDMAEDPERPVDRAHAAGSAKVEKSAANNREEKGRRRSSEKARSDRPVRAKRHKILDLAGLGVMIAVVVPSLLLCVVSFFSKFAAVLSILCGSLAVFLGVGMYWFLLYREGVDMWGGDQSFLVRRVWPFICMVKYTIEKPRRFGPWFVVGIFGITLFVAGTVINEVVKPPLYPGWKPPPEPGLAAAASGAPAANQERAAPEKSGPPKVTGEAALDQALVDLEKGDSPVCQAAADKLAKLLPNQEHRALIAQKLAARATDTNASTRRSVIQALGVWGTANEVLTLIDCLNDPDFGNRRETLRIIGKFRDERTLAPVSRCFVESITRTDAGQAFRDMGSMAERELLTFLQSDDVFMRLDVVNILKDIGTQASVPTLQGLLAADNVHTNQAVKDALAAIARRK
jgi:hypothetical protein